ncbi:MAG: hypothetical protein AAB484_02775 [Patescibacteria group bacterium]
MTDRRKVKRLLKILIAFFIVALIGGYGVFRGQTLAEGPKINISEPVDGSLVSQSLVIVSGIAKNISFLNLNGAQIFTDEAGLFKEKILLSHGYNIITLEASDRFGRKTEKSLQIIYK